MDTSFQSDHSLCIFTNDLFFQDSSHDITLHICALKKLFRDHEVLCELLLTA